MGLSDWAESTAHTLLHQPLPRRWAHTQGVAARARTLALVLGADAELVEAVAWLHDIGYAPCLHDTGFHPLDGARYLREVVRADPLLCRMVAHHSGALIEADERGIGADLAREFRPAPCNLADALTYCDMTTSPDGEDIGVRERIAEVLRRYGTDHVVSRAIARSAPEMIGAVLRVQSSLATLQLARRRRTQTVLAVAGTGQWM